MCKTVGLLHTTDQISTELFALFKYYYVRRVQTYMYSLFMSCMN